MANVADTITYIVRETGGATPATPAFKSLDNTSVEFNLESNMITSNVLRANRAAGDSTETGFYVTGTVRTDFRSDAAWDMLIESYLGNAFATGVAKGGANDLSQTIEQKMVGASGPLYFRYTGVQATSLGISVDPSKNVEITADVIGRASTNSTASLTGATYTKPTQGAILTGAGQGSVTIAGLDATYYSLEFKGDQARSPRFGLFEQNAFGISTGEPRKITLTLQLYRDDLSAESVFVPNTPIPVSFTLGSGSGNVYTIELPRMFAKRPKNDRKDSDEMITVELTTADDATLGSDIKVTKS